MTMAPVIMIKVIITVTNKEEEPKLMVVDHGV